MENLNKLKNKTVQNALDLFREYPEIYNKISLGTHEIDGKAELNVDVYAFAYGFTQKLTGYIGVPIYDAKVFVQYKKSAPDTNQEVAEQLQKKYGDDWAQTLGNVMETMLTVDDRIIQSALVNSLGYEELGDWRGQGLGDTELGIIYNFYTTPTFGLAITLGGIAPTGRIDDPDLLQDIGFGDGQWDAFVELGGGHKSNQVVTLNSFLRYTHQFASKKRLRVPYDEDIIISDVVQNFDEKLGNKILVNANADLALSDWLTLTPGYIIEYIGKANYSSKNSKANNILAKDSESFAQNFRLSTKVSTLNFYRQKNFFAPLELTLSYQNMIQGQNTPKVDLVELDFRLYF